MSKLAMKLTATPLREQAGARTAARLHYQSLVGLCLIFEMHGTKDDYAIVFEFHDDIAVLDSSTNPTKVSFYQVKTKQGSEWQLSHLLKQEAAKGKGASVKLPSIIGKMYINADQFGEYVDHISFVTNAAMKFGKGAVEFDLSACAEDEIKKLCAQIEIEFPLAPPVNTSLIKFKRTNLSLEDHDTHAKGKLSQFVVDHLGEVSFSLEALYRAVSDECRRKSQVIGQDTDFTAMLLRRAITKQDASSWLARVKSSIESPTWDEVGKDFNGPALMLVRMRRFWGKYITEVLNPNSAINAIRGEINRQFDAADYESFGSLQDIVDDIFPKILPFATSRINPISPERIKVMILYEICR